MEMERFSTQPKNSRVEDLGLFPAAPKSRTTSSQQKMTDLQAIIESGRADSQIYDLINHLAFRHGRSEQILKFYAHQMSRLPIASRPELAKAQKKLQVMHTCQLEFPKQSLFSPKGWASNPQTRRFVTWMIPCGLLILATLFLLPRH